MLTCSYFSTIAKRHFIRVVCLPNAEKVNAFAGYLKQVLESGDYGIGVLPIQHLAVAGKYSTHLPLVEHHDARSDAELEAEKYLHFIIMTAAPSLLTLTVFGMDCHTQVEIEANGRKRCHARSLPNTVKFPQLRDLVALEQLIIPLALDDAAAYTSRFPNLRRLYVQGDMRLGSLLLELPNLHHLRLEMLNTVTSRYLPCGQIPPVHSLIIDAPQYSKSIGNMHSMFHMHMVHIYSTD